MYFDVFSVKEVNAYYDRKGGIRASGIGNYANASNFATLMRQAATRRNAEVSGASAEESALSTRPKATAQSRTTPAAGTAGSGIGDTFGSTIDGASGYGQTRAYLNRTTRQSAAGVHTGLPSNTATGTYAALASKSAATAHAPGANGKTDAASTAPAPNTAQANGNICCEQCHETAQMMFQMMTKNLYTQSALGYPLTGMNAWTAYQSMGGMIGSLFS